MICVDFRCHACGYTKELIVNTYKIKTKVCPKCGYDMYRILTLGRGNSMPVDCDWIGTVREVVNKNPNTQKLEDREFLKSPTRQNYNKWMKANKLRPLESGERTEPKKPDMKKFAAEQKHDLKKKFAKDNAITL